MARGGAKGPALVAVPHDLNHAARCAAHLVVRRDGSVAAECASGVPTVRRPVRVRGPYECEGPYEGDRAGFARVAGAGGRRGARGVF